MIQYCRYCANALDYNGEAEDFVCSADAECGDFGAGHFYDASKAKRPNKCKHFVFNPLDVFYTTYGEREYKPRTTTKGGLMNLHINGRNDITVSK